MGVNAVNNFQQNKVGANFELMYGAQVGAQQTTIPQMNYASVQNVNMDFKQGQLMARLQQFDHNPQA